MKKETCTNTGYYKLLKLQLKYKVHKLHQRMYLVITRMPAESHRRPLGPLLLCLYDVSRTLINSLVCRIAELLLGFQRPINRMWSLQDWFQVCIYHNCLKCASLCGLKCTYKTMAWNVHKPILYALNYTYTIWLELYVYYNGLKYKWLVYWFEV